MSTPSPLPPGAFFTTINGRKCSAIPRSSAASSAAAAESTAKNTNVGNAGADTNVATSTTSSSLVIVIRTSSSSTSTSISTSTTSIAQTTIAQAQPPPLLVPNPAIEQTLAGPAVVTPPAAVTTSSSTVGLDSTSTSSLTAPSQNSQSQQAQASGAQSSETDDRTTAPGANAGTAAQQQGTALPEVTPSPVLTDSAGASPLFTTIGTAAPSSDNAAAAATDTNGSTNSAVSAIPNPNSNAVQSTVAVAGGVIGGVVALSLIAFLVWWWRRRAMKKRRSTLLTPLTTTPSFGRDEKGAYVINRGSIGPTPMSEKIRAALDYNMKKIRNRMSALVARSGASSPSINMNRGNSQFMEPVSTHSRVNSSATSIGAKVTTKDRFKDWLSRLTADMNFNWRMRNNSGMPTSAEAMSAAAVGNREKKGVLGSQPDFLTLLSMDEGELDQEAQRRRARLSRKNGSNASAEHFLGGLNLNFNNSEDPFSDDNALAHRSAKPAPLIVSQPNNPFSDENAIRNPAPTVPKPTTYVADIRRSRGQSVTATRPPSAAYRESVASVESFQTRRNKFRSDPFDLERPELLAGARQAQNSISSSLAGSTGGSLPRDSRIPSKPAGAHTRSESFTSKYSSGVSMGDWSDPGPDVGPGSGPRWDGPEARESPTQGWRDRQEREAAQHARGGGRESGGSQGSVGKAM